jgi:hypothetical protein
MLKAASYITDAYTDPNYSDSSNPRKTAFNLSLRTELSYWEWIETGAGDANLCRMKRTAAAMKATQRWEDRDGILNGNSSHLNDPSVKTYITSYRLEFLIERSCLK